MTAKKLGKGGLGKGLGSFGLSGSFKEGHKGGYEIEIHKIQPNPHQPRKRFTEAELQSLADSIAHYGVVSPIAVRKVDDHYEIIAGERRWRASQLAGLSKIPVIVKEFSTEEVSEIALVENLQRQNLDPMEEAFAYQHLVNTFHQTQEQIAATVGKSRSYVANMMRLIQLPDFVQQALVEGVVTVGQARPLLSLKTETLQKLALERIVTGQLSARQIEQLVKQLGANTTEKPSRKKESSAELRQLIQRLKVSLGTPVDIRLKNSKTVQGTIEITFKSEEELLRVIALMEE